MIFLDSRVCLLDCETTDLIVDRYPQIWQVAGIIVDGMTLEYQDSFNYLIRPPSLDGITPSVRRLTGISKADLESCPSFAEVYPYLMRRLKSGTIRCASWGCFDERVLWDATHSIGRPHVSRQAWIDCQSYLHAVCVEVGIRPPSFALKQVMESFGMDVSLYAFHTAGQDATALWRLLQEVQDLRRQLTCQAMEDSTKMTTDD